MFSILFYIQERASAPRARVGRSLGAPWGRAIAAPFGAVKRGARGRTTQRAKKRGSEPNEPRARSRSAARREHEGERRSDRTSRASKEEGAATGARAPPWGSTHPLHAPRTPAEPPTGAFLRVQWVKSHCRTTLRQGAPAGRTGSEYKRKHPRVHLYTPAAVYTCKFQRVIYNRKGQARARTHKGSAPQSRPPANRAAATGAAERPRKGGERGAAQESGRANGGALPLGESARACPLPFYGFIRKLRKACYYKSLSNSLNHAS